MQQHTSFRMATFHRTYVYSCDKHHKPSIRDLIRQRGCAHKEKKPTFARRFLLEGFGVGAGVEVETGGIAGAEAAEGNWGTKSSWVGREAMERVSSQ